MNLIFRNKNYAKFWLAELISVFGSRIQSSAIIWSVYMATDSILMLGLLAIVESLPALLFSFHAGIISERYKKYNLYWLCQISNLLTTLLIFSILVLMPDKIYLIVIILFIQNTASTISGPSKKVLLYSITDKDDLPNAIRLEALVGNLAKVLGPPVAGIVLLLVSPELCFLLNALTYIPFIVVGKKFNINNKYAPIIKKKSTKSEIKDLFTYLRGNVEIVTSLVFLFISCMFLYNYTVIIPVISKDILNLNSMDFSLIYTVNGLGNILGNFLVKSSGKNNRAIKSNKKYLASLVTIIAFIYIGITLSISYYLTLLLFFITGAVNSLYQVTSSIIIQSAVDDSYRARVSSFYTFVTLGISPFAKLNISLLIYMLQPKIALLTQGMICLICIMVGYIFISRFRRDVKSATDII